MLQRVYLIFVGPVDLGSGFVIECKDQPIVFRPYNLTVMVTDTIWSTEIVRQFASSYLHARGIFGAVVAD